MTGSARQVGSYSVVALALMALLTGSAGAQVTTFYVARHAERPSDAEGGADPPLTVIGMRRAEELRDILRGAPITAVYSTRTLRTWQTATPTATLAGVPVTAYDALSPAWFEDLKTRHLGRSVLIVGHSDTVGNIIKGLGGTAIPPVGDEFDNLFVVSSEGALTRTERRKYHALEPIKRVEFAGVPHPSDLSAVAAGPSGDGLVIASDEGSAIQVLKKTGDGYEIRSTIALGTDEEKEFDIEGVARHGSGTTYFVAGLHAFRRKSIFREEDRDATLAKIRKRFEESPDREKDRERLIRLTIDPDTGRPVEGSRSEFSLRGLIDGHAVLKPFARLPATENGIDIEGIASDGERLFLGLRGPVFRFGFALVLVFNPEDPDDLDLRYINMEGRGVRDLVRVSDGFLVIGGPVGDSSLSSRLYHWDGNNGLPGVRGAAAPPQGRVTLLGTIQAPPNAEPEGLMVLRDETNAFYEVLIVYDGVVGGSPTVFRVPKPSGS